MPETIRAFIAIELPETIRFHIRGIQDRMKTRGFRMRWVRPENIHLTLKFLGNIPPANIDDIGAALAESAREASPPSLSARGLGVFPGIRKPRVLWTGLKGDTHRLIEFQKQMDEWLETVGLPKETRPFKAHLTVARIKDRQDPARLAAAMSDFGGMETEAFSADWIVLFKSELKPSGAVYTKLREIYLVDRTGSDRL